MDYSIIPFLIKYTDSLWAVLFILLFTWVLKSNNSREKRYLRVIDQLSEKIDANLCEIDHKVTDQGEKLTEIRKEIQRIRKG